jgi:hypothetical protein
MVNLNNLSPNKEGNLPELLPCPACGSEALSGWGMLGSAVYCSSEACKIALVANTDLHQWDLGVFWNSLERLDNETREKTADD